jgi:hypothetical protein
MKLESSNSSKKGTKRVPFPQRLFHLLKLAEENGWEDIISWVDDGKGFKVHDRKKFEQELLVKYFNTTRYPSFTRQLHAYDFDCVRTGRQTGIYSHPNFTRENPEASCSLKREGASKSLAPKAISAASKTKKNQAQVPPANLLRLAGFRAGDTIVQFPSLLWPRMQEGQSTLSCTSGNDSASTQFSTVNRLYESVCSQVSNRTRRALIRIPSGASDVNPFNDVDNASLSASPRAQTTSSLANHHQLRDCHSATVADNMIAPTGDTKVV